MVDIWRWGCWFIEVYITTATCRKKIDTRFRVVPVFGLGRRKNYPEHGTRHALRETGAQLRFEARITNEQGRFREVEFVHDTGAASNIIKLEDAATEIQKIQKTRAMSKSQVSHPKTKNPEKRPLISILTFRPLIEYCS